MESVISVYSRACGGNRRPVPLPLLPALYQPDARGGARTPALSSVPLLPSPTIFSLPRVLGTQTFLLPNTVCQSCSHFITWAGYVRAFTLNTSTAAAPPRPATPTAPHPPPPQSKPPHSTPHHCLACVALPRCCPNGHYPISLGCRKQSHNRQTYSRLQQSDPLLIGVKSLNPANILTFQSQLRPMRMTASRE